MANDKRLGRQDKLGFGKNKGKTISSLLKSEPEYLMWLRKERRKNQMVETFDDDVNAVLDKALSRDKTLRKQYNSVPIAKIQVASPIAGLTTQPDRTEFYTDEETGWGAF